MNNGQFIISLDFELFWGMHDVIDLEKYKENIQGARTNIPKILRFFENENIHATWATVGFLFAQNFNDLQSFIPENFKYPTYSNSKRNSYKYLDKVKGSPNLNDYFFAPHLVSLIHSCKNQELASHTFSHYYCGSKGQTIEQFEEDLSKSNEISKKLTSFNNVSIVFPRNQSKANYVKTLKKQKFKCFRGEEDDWIHQMKGYTFIKRLLRLIDSYFSLTGSGCYLPIKQDGLLNLKGSRFLRPYNHKLRFLERLKVNRIKNQMLYAAQNNMVFHLWWHPHNFGQDFEKNMQNLKEIVIYFKKLSLQYGMKSLNMKESFELFKSH